jgi:hypothetical protein
MGGVERGNRLTRKSFRRRRGRNGSKVEQNSAAAASSLIELKVFFFFSITRQTKGSKETFVYFSPYKL